MWNKESTESAQDHMSRTNLSLKVLDFVQLGGLRATQTGRRVVMGGSWSLREIMKDEPSTIGITDDCHVAENYNGMRPVRRLSKVYGVFNPARKLVEHDKLTVVSVNGEKFVAIKGLRERVCPAEMLVPGIR